MKFFKVLVIVVLLGLVTGCSMLNNEDRINRRREEILLKAGNDFYEKYYIQVTGAGGVSSLAKHSSKGIVINLENLKRGYIDSDVMGIFDDFNCDYKETKVTIYPQEPYGPTDYEIKVNTKCE